MFLGYIHTFRAIAIFFIVAGHSIDTFNWTDSPDLGRALRIFFSNGTILFVFIAGYLFQYLSPRYDVKKYFISKLKNVLLPYVLISIPAILIFTLVQKRDTVWDGFYDEPLWLQVVNFYVTGTHLAPLWFIPMITLFYLISPVLIWADKVRFFYFSIPLFIVLSCFVSRGFPLQSFVHFFSVYALGMFCSRYKSSVNALLETSTFLTVAGTAVIVFGLCEFYLMEGTMTYFNLLQKLTLSILILGILIRLKEKSSSHYLNLVADTSFGIFFVHSYILTASRLSYEKLFGIAAEGSFSGFIFFTFGMIVISTAAVCIIKQILGTKSKFLVGS